MLEVQGRRKAYGGKPVLNGVSFGVAEGETVAIIGPSARAGGRCCAA